MAVYVLLLKEYEDEEKVIYKYGPNEEILGKIQYDKKLDKIIEIKPIVKEGVSNEFYFRRAAQKIAVMSKMEGNIFPNIISRES